MAVGGSGFLVDKSALARLRDPSVAAVLAPLIESGRLAVSSVLELEVLYSARSLKDFEDTCQDLRSFPHLVIGSEDFDRAIEVMALLARRGQHRAAGLADLLQAAVAERNGATLLHYDHDFDVIGAQTGQPMQWVVPPGTVP